MKYEITWAETIKKGETNGKPWEMTKMTLKDEAGKVTENVTTFDKVMNGTTIEGEIVQKGQYLNFATKKAVAGANFKTAQIEKTMERKEQSINKFQDNKELSIKIASTMNKAVELTIAELNLEKTLKPSSIDIENRIIKWRGWLWEHWDVADDQYPPFM